MKAMAVVALVLLLLAPPAVSQVTDDKLIVPGQRIGKWALGMTIGELLQASGQSQRTSDGQKVLFLRTDAAEFKTEKGVTPTVPREQVEAAYGRPTAETRPNPSARRIIYDAIGFAVLLLASGNVETSFVFRAGDAKTIWRF